MPKNLGDIKHNLNHSHNSHIPANKTNASNGLASKITLSKLSKSITAKPTAKNLRISNGTPNKGSKRLTQLFQRIVALS
jgi:hypothetical protein